ncbi:MAG: type II toxin-antitoxin system RelE/ParE family toxin [Limisphaerales bacterium]
MAEFRKSRLVDQDLLEIWLYIARDNPDAADRVIRAAETTFTTLAQSPDLGRLRKFGRRIRSFRVQGFSNYLVFYRETELGVVEIVRVLHGARNLEELL